MKVNYKSVFKDSIKGARLRKTLKGYYGPYFLAVGTALKRKIIRTGEIPASNVGGRWVVVADIEPSLDFETWNLVSKLRAEVSIIEFYTKEKPELNHYKYGEEEEYNAQWELDGKAEMTELGVAIKKKDDCLKIKIGSVIKATRVSRIRSLFFGI